MKAYRLSVNLKLGLIVFAIAIAVTSLWYTNDLVQRLRQQETAIVRLWALALEQVPLAAQRASVNPHQNDFRLLESAFEESRSGSILSETYTREQIEGFRRAMSWARTMSPTSDLSFILDAFLEPNAFSIPAILVDSSLGQPTVWRNVDVGVQSVAELDSVLRVDSTRHKDILDKMDDMLREMATLHEPVQIVLSYPDMPLGSPSRLVQSMYYGESAIVQTLRWFPYLQLAFVALFVLVGYVGFSYIRRSEQSSLWVGMAKEAAHQLGTPISSLMGWLAVLRLEKNPSDAHVQAYNEIEQDIQRLTRVTRRFSDIGSLPRLVSQPLDLVIGGVAEYMRSRFPQQSGRVLLDVDIDSRIMVAVNAELFEWVIENLIKNALDALEGETGNISISARVEERRIIIDVSDTGKGIDRRNAKNVFRPGYSTKKRGWGLGLSLAHRIIHEYHGGKLTLLNSRLGVGTTFRIELPHVRVD